MRTFSQKHSKTRSTSALSRQSTADVSLSSLTDSLSSSTISIPSHGLFNKANSKLTSSTEVFQQKNEQHRQEVNKLRQSLQKFTNYKKNNTSKTNILRLTLLQYLRYPPDIYVNLRELVSISLSDVDQELIILEAKTALNWWSHLLTTFMKDSQNIPSLDRTCYLECLSRLSSMALWIFIENHKDHSSELNDIFEQYSKLLLQVFEYSISRLNNKGMPAKMNSFVGKIFAQAYFKLPNVSRGLSFLLNTKVANYKSIYNLCIYNTFSKNQSFNLSSSESEICRILDDVASQFPQHLTPLIFSTVKPRQVQYIIQNHFMNSIIPPKDKIEGIKETKGLWVNRWSSIDNAGIFCSFFRHYITISSFYLKNIPLIMINKYHIFGIPGFICMLTHVFQIIENEVRQRQNINYKGGQSSQKKYFEASNVNVSSFSSPFIMIPPTSPENSSERIFNIIRDIIINPRNPYESLTLIGLVKGFENILKSVVIKTKLFDNTRVEIVLDLFVNFVRSLDVDVTQSNDEFEILGSFMHKSLLDQLDWKFWINILIKMLNSKNLQAESRAVLVLYEIWDYFSADIYEFSSKFDGYESGKHDYHSSSLEGNGEDNWFSDSKENLKRNLVFYILKENNWNKFFGHYNSLFRNLFVKLVVWKMLGLTSLGLSVVGSKFDTDILLKQNIIESLEIRLGESYQLTKYINFKPKEPAFNKKFVIRKLSNFDDGKKEKKSRVCPYEIFDEAVYLSSEKKFSNSGPSTPIIDSKGASSGSSPLDSPQNSVTKLADLMSPTKKQSKRSTWMGKIFHKSDKERLPGSSTRSSIITDLDKPPSIGSIKSSISLTDLDKRRALWVSSLGSASVSNINNTENADVNYLQPPELKFSTTVLFKENYEFNVVADEMKVFSLMHDLNQLNSGISTFKKEGLGLTGKILNRKPRLPHLYREISQEDFEDNLVLDDYDNTISDTINDLVSSDLNFSVTRECDLETSLEESKFENVGLTSGFATDSSNLSENKDSSSEKTKDTSPDPNLPLPNLGNSCLIDSNTIQLKSYNSLLINIANGIKEFNDNVEEFVNFVENRLKELNQDDIFHINTNFSKKNSIWNNNEDSTLNLNITNSSSDDSVLELNLHNKSLLKLKTEGFKELRRNIPNIISELPGDRLNAY
ncbi:hypothetical protein DAMA08_039860 [Martiniozyma asiatica (nom. inval.)]|nr:hypothetical protein DAMA08_039860 [Martiniozyma asiatica]